MVQLMTAADEPRLKPIKGEIPAVDEPSPKQDHLLALLSFGNDIRDVAMELSVDAFDGEARRALFRYLVMHPDGLEPEQVPTELQPFETYVKIVQLKAETRYNELHAQERAREASHLVGQIKQQHLKQKKLTLTSQLRDAEAGGNETDILRLRNELNDLIKEENTRGKNRT
jgi:hypothetical protein